jgi:hypothetical protein
MLQEQTVSTKDCCDFLRESFSSIKELNRRIDELRMVINAGWCEGESKKKVLNRISLLMATRCSLIYGIYDMRLKIIDSFPVHSNEKKGMEKILKFETLYKELKNL